MRDYELMIVFDPNLEEAATEAVTGRVSTLVTQRGGNVASTEAWGRRRLAYPIGRHRDGTYVLMRFQVDPAAVIDVERMLKLSEAVIRHLAIRAETAEPAPARAA